MFLPVQPSQTIIIQTFSQCSSGLLKVLLRTVFINWGDAEQSAAEILTTQAGDPNIPFPQWAALILPQTRLAQ